MKSYIINIKALLATIACLVILAILGYANIEIDSDIVSSLPKKDPVLSDAAYVLKHHPMQDLVVIDISYQKKDPNVLVEAGSFVQKELKNSSLFSSVGMEAFEDLIPEIMLHVSQNLPVLFSEKELNQIIEPLLSSQNIKKKLKENYMGLQDINSIGMSEMLSNDPIGLSDTILSKLLYLSPSQNVNFYNGHLISKDGNHLLIIAQPKQSGTNTDFAKKAVTLFNDVSDKLNNAFKHKDDAFTVQHIGSFRYALDNETIAKSDTKRALFLATIGITLMLILVFPRPLIGLFSFLPAISGTVMSFFVYSLFHDKISILALGFGGAIISITVDHGIAYLLFLDQEHETYGKEAAREVWSVGLLATLTTVFAFLSLFISGFPVFAQVGQFAAFGILFSFIFVHTLFPRIFPNMPPATRKKPSLIQNFTNRLALSDSKIKLICAGVFLCGMIIFAKPVFHVDLSSLNTISEETSETESHIRQTWGNVSDRIFLVSEAKRFEDLQTTSDNILALLEEDILNLRLSPSFISSMIFPGIKRSNDNFAAWKSFWSKNRISILKSRIRKNAAQLGFSMSAFDPFFHQIQEQSVALTPISERFYTFLGIEKELNDKNETVLYRQFYTLTPGEYYTPDDFFIKYQQTGTIKIFDPNYYTKKLGANLTSAFIRMFIIIFISLSIFLLLFFWDVRLAITALLPVCFAFICTLGTMNIFSHPIDIPGLMLSIVVLGMGIDYSLYFVRSHQRYFDESHHSFKIIRTAVFLASISTLIGFGVMCFARHSILKSAGMISFFGILYSLIGAFFILPFLLKRLFVINKKCAQPTKSEHKRTYPNVLKYYRHMEGFVRVYAYFKLKIDPMYKELGNLLSPPKYFIDIGCGYGVTALWIINHFSGSTVFGIEPDVERARIASNALKHIGTVVRGKAPDLPKLPDNADTALMIDVAHFLSNDDLQKTLKHIFTALIPNGNFLMRVTIPSDKRFPYLRWIEIFRSRITRSNYYLRSLDILKSMVSQSGFDNVSAQKSGKNREEFWILGKKPKTM